MHPAAAAPRNLIFRAEMLFPLLFHSRPADPHPEEGGPPVAFGETENKECISQAQLRELCPRQEPSPCNRLPLIVDPSTLPPPPAVDGYPIKRVPSPDLPRPSAYSTLSA